MPASDLIKSKSKVTDHAQKPRKETSMKKPVAPPFSDKAVKEKTGKTWSKWFAILDKAGARTMKHSEIAAYLYEKKKVPGWWCQMVAVAYERARGLRKTHETTTGYSISRSKTLDVPIKTLFAAFSDIKKRAQWLPRNSIVIRTATPTKSMRIGWSDKKTIVAVNFYEKGSGKSQVVVQHDKLPDATHAKQMKEYWGKRLDLLCTILSP